MKKAFTLVEMLVVVVVLVTLMTITFRLGSLGGSSSARTTTIARIQKLENCLSGYYAAFGTYPPVKLHGSRNPYLRVSAHGIQNLDGDENVNIFGWDVEKFRRGDWDKNEDDAWRQVKAACKSQPVECEFPFPDGFGEFVDANSDLLKSEAENSDSLSPERKQMFASGFDDGVSRNIGRFGAYQDKVEWRDLQLFKFGLLSYLLPRYLVMMRADKSLYEDFAQWTGNNKLPCDPMTGLPYNNWGQINRHATSKQKTDLARVANIPSQSVCARWIPNLERLVYTPHSTRVFGIELRYDGTDSGFTLNSSIYSPGSFDDDSTSGQYMLDFCTVRDGWGNDIYYYSPAPYQTYVLWSAGPNGRTFPPWVAREGLNDAANKCVGAWIEDDIVDMRN